MPDDTAKIRAKKRRRAVLASLSLLTVLIASGLVLAFVEKVRDASDRAT